MIEIIGIIASTEQDPIALVAVVVAFILPLLLQGKLGCGPWDDVLLYFLEAIIALLALIAMLRTEQGVQYYLGTIETIIVCFISGFLGIILNQIPVRGRD